MISLVTKSKMAAVACATLMSIYGSVAEAKNITTEIPVPVIAKYNFQINTAAVPMIKESLAIAQSYENIAVAAGEEEIVSDAEIAALYDTNEYEQYVVYNNAEEDIVDEISDAEVAELYNAEYEQYVVYNDATEVDYIQETTQVAAVKANNIQLASKVVPIINLPAPSYETVIVSYSNVDYNDLRIADINLIEDLDISVNYNTAHDSFEKVQDYFVDSESTNVGNIGAEENSVYNTYFNISNEISDNIKLRNQVGFAYNEAGGVSPTVSSALEYKVSDELDFMIDAKQSADIYGTDSISHQLTTQVLFSF